MPPPPDRRADIASAAAHLAAAEARLSAAVTAARADGHTWQDIGDVLGVSRQAAFKRFGVVVDPQTAKPVAAHRSLDVPAFTTDVFTRLAAGDDPWIRERMTHACGRELTRRRIADVWHDVLDEVGELQDVTDVEAREIDGRTPLTLQGSGTAPLPAVGRALLNHEAGEMVGHVMINRAGKIAGLLLGPAQAEDTWPF